MIGYWDESCPVTTNHPDVKATVYIRPEKILIALGNFGAEDHSVRLRIDFKKLGFDPAKVTIEAPRVKDFQEKRLFGIDEPVPVKSKEGWLLEVRR